MKFAYVLYDNFTLLDIVGPYNVLTLLGHHEPIWVGEKSGAVVEWLKSIHPTTAWTTSECRTTCRGRIGWL
jgi:putative intracellular protease/amidase